MNKGYQFGNTFLPGHLNRSGSGLEIYSGAFGKDQILHLLRRTTFGATTEDIDLLSGMTVETAVDTLLSTSKIPPSPPINNYSSSKDPTGVLPGETWVNAAYHSTVNNQRNESFKSWWIGLMWSQSCSIEEKMCLFWHNHFATETTATFDARFVYKHHTLLRQYALGNFKELTRLITTDPAMLVYLNGYVNTKFSPDENYARELQELFTLGKGPGSKYTEEDVRAVSRLLTGWKVNQSGNSSYFDPLLHDSADKHFSGFYDNAVIRGLGGSNGGMFELNELIELMFAKEEVSKFIARKLYRYFIYYNIDSLTESKVIEPLAQIIRSNNYEIKPALRQLLCSAHFFDPVNAGCFIKTPLDLVIGLLRTTDVTIQSAVTDPKVTTIQRYGVFGAIKNISAKMQMNIGDPPNVAGWPAYYQSPLFYQLWINSDTLATRNLFVDVMASNTGIVASNAKILIDPITLAKKFPHPEDPDILIDEIVEYLYAIPISSTTKEQLKISTLLSGQLSDHYWTDAWSAFESDPEDVANKNSVSIRLRTLLKALMNGAEFQLC